MKDEGEEGESSEGRVTFFGMFGQGFQSVTHGSVRGWYYPSWTGMLVLFFCFFFFFIDFAL